MIKSTTATRHRIEIIIFTLMLIATLNIIQPASATLNISSAYNGYDISWVWDKDITITAIALDGIIVSNRDNISYSYRLPIMGNNNYGNHTLTIYSDTDSGTSTVFAYEPTDIVDTSTAIILGYLFFIIAVILILIGTQIPFIAWAGAGFAIIGIVDMQNVSFWGAFVFMVVFASAVFVAFGDD